MQAPRCASSFTPTNNGPSERLVDGRQRALLGQMSSGRRVGQMVFSCDSQEDLRQITCAQARQTVHCKQSHQSTLADPKLDAGHAQPITFLRSRLTRAQAERMVVRGGNSDVDRSRSLVRGMLKWHSQSLCLRCEMRPARPSAP